MPRTRHIHIYIYDALDNRYGFSISVQHGIDCTTFHSFFSWKVWTKKVFKNFQKLAGLWLVGEVDNHVPIYGSKVAEGFSAFQRRSCSHGHPPQLNNVGSGVVWVTVPGRGTRAIYLMAWCRYLSCKWKDNQYLRLTTPLPYVQY